MTDAGSSVLVKRPDLCRACRRQEECPRKNTNAGACWVRRNYFDAGYLTALSMIQSAVDYERARKLKPPTPRKRLRRRR